MRQHETLAGYFLKNASEKKFIREIETKKVKTHKEILAKAIQISNNDYIQANQIVTVILPNSITYIEHFLAAMIGGYIFNPLPYFTQTQELKKIFEYIDPAIILTDREDISSIFSKSNEIFIPDQFDSFSGEYEKVGPKSEQVAALYYSSGTTGNPKGVLFSHKNMLSLISSIVRGFKFSRKDRQLAFLPFGHTASINYNILPSLLVGCDLYISQGFETLRNNFFNVLDKYKITYTEIVPTVLFLLNKLKVDISDLDLSKLEFIGCGSSTLPLSTQIEFIEQYGIKVGNLYGLSETGPTHIDDPRESGWEPGSVGVSLDVNECRISEDGEILIKGENVFVGYHKNEKLYEKSVIEGWYNTGDLGEEKDGKLFFIDRKKDLIIKSGINIVPMEIEEVVHKHPAIIECVAVGKTSTIHGEEVAVVAVKNSDVDSDDLIGEIKRLCRESLSAYKVPNQIFFWDSIPKTPSKKLLRRKVRDLINSSQKDTDTSKKAYPHLNKTTKQIAGVNGFGRFGLHLIKYWLDRYDMACFTINYINDDTLSINQAIKVIRNDKKVVFKKYLIKKIGSKIRFSWGKGKMHEIQFTNVPKAQIPWLGEPELFFECSGRNTVKKNCMGFLTGETKHVIVSATSWDADKTLVYGFNHKEYDPKPNQVISYGSCTVNAFIPMANFINNNFGVVDADVNVIHNIQEYLLQKNYTLDRRFCTLEKSAPKMLEYLNKNNFTVKYTVVPYTGVSIFDFRFKLKNKFSLEQFLEKLEYEINEGELNGFYGLHEIDNGPEEHNCTSFSSVLIKEKIRLLNKQLYIFSYFDNENSVNRYYDLVNFIANKNKSSVLENSFMPKKNIGSF